MACPGSFSVEPSSPLRSLQPARRFSSTPVLSGNGSTGTSSRYAGISTVPLTPTHLLRSFRAPFEEQLVDGGYFTAAGI